MQKYPKTVIQGHRDFFGDTNKDGKIDSRDWLKDTRALMLNHRAQKVQV